MIDNIAVELKAGVQISTIERNICTHVHTCIWSLT
ncbi:MAG: hypothetical protein SVE93_03165 [Candidatus Thermoplasmatota archaeon]|nr:hypothetical protein [Candidatus Thermoplasmatota archaeon]